MVLIEYEKGMVELGKVYFFHTKLNSKFLHIELRTLSVFSGYCEMVNEFRSL